MPPSGLKYIVSRCGIKEGYLDCDVYNGSNWGLTEIALTVTVRDKNGKEVLTRSYKMHPVDGLPFDPDRSSEGLVPLGFSIELGQTWSWTLSGAKGISPN
jgi:hypothetical protein